MGAIMGERSQTVDSILEKYPNTFTDEEKKFLKSKELENLRDNLFDFLSEIDKEDLLQF